jgi:predicted ATPase
VFSQLPVRRVQRREDVSVGLTPWAASIPAVQQVLRDGLDLGPATVLVGENGAGKSTITEAVAIAFGLSREGGSTHARHTTRDSEANLAQALQLERGAGASRWGFFLRAETMHGLYTYLENLGGSPDPPFHEMSHGESFLEVLLHKFDSPGLYVLDEPESALSFTGCLALVGHLHRLAGIGTAQVIVATHSPIIAALPGARILEVGDWGLRECAWEDLALVDHWRRFLDRPEAYLRHVLAPD